MWFRITYGFNFDIKDIFYNELYCGYLRYFKKFGYYQNYHQLLEGFNLKKKVI